MLEYEQKIDVHVEYICRQDELEDWICEETEIRNGVLILHKVTAKSGFCHTLVGLPLNNIKNWAERIPNT